MKGVTFVPVSDGKPAPQVHAHGCTRCWWRHEAQSHSPRQAPHRAAAGARGRHTAGPGRTACCSHTASGNARAAGLSACASSGSRRWWPAGCTCEGVRRLHGQQPHLPTAGAWGHLAPTDLMVWSLCRMTSWICRSTVTLVSSSSCFCVLASATHVRYVAMASSAWDRAERCTVRPQPGVQAPRRNPVSRRKGLSWQDTQPGQRPRGDCRHGASSSAVPSPRALTLFLASSSRRRRLSRALEAVPPAPGPVPACSSSALATRRRALSWSSQRCP